MGTNLLTKSPLLEFLLTLFSAALVPSHFYWHDSFAEDKLVVVPQFTLMQIFFPEPYLLKCKLQGDDDSWERERKKERDRQNELYNWKFGR
jgi:hypothetical protein